MALLSPTPYDDPTVAIRHPVIGAHDGTDVEVDDALVVICSTCGEVSDWEPVSGQEPPKPADVATRANLRHIAKDHASLVHDGLVAAEGWVK